MVVPPPSELVACIAADLATWAPHPVHVELAIYGTDDAAAIAAALDELCAAALGARIAGARFYGSSVGSVAGVVLADGREVVIKAHQPGTSASQLRELIRVRARLGGVGSPRVLAGPAPIGRGHAVIEALVARGAWAEPHEPAVRRLLVRGLYAIVEACGPEVAASTLGPMLLGALPPERLWPVPHSKLFDFEATAAGAGWIDDVARAARAVPRAGELVIGHADWRAEHVRFADGAIAVAYDWDSLARDREPALVGSCAHAFTADWTRAGRAQAPTLDEARAFVEDYEAARGRRFERAERAACAATFAYACAYTARCGHALGRDERDEPGTFQHLVARHGGGLLAL
ncbi:MAG TPA: hypothetical protein VNO30_43335 [Kofleriaceae bacterium]|nr:hypothetical protein [Kofleriaceae bacterium]